MALARLHAKRHLIDDEGWTEAEWTTFSNWLTRNGRLPKTNDEWELAAMEWINS